MGREQEKNSRVTVQTVCLSLSSQSLGLLTAIGRMDTAERAQIRHSRRTVDVRRTVDRMSGSCLTNTWSRGRSPQTGVRPHSARKKRRSFNFVLWSSRLLHGLLVHDASTAARRYEHPWYFAKAPQPRRRKGMTTAVNIIDARVKKENRSTGNWSLVSDRRVTIS